MTRGVLRWLDELTICRRKKMQTDIVASFSTDIESFTTENSVECELNVKFEMISFNG